MTFSTADTKDINSEAKTRNNISSDEPSEQDTHENSVKKNKVGSLFASLPKCSLKMKFIWILFFLLT